MKRRELIARLAAAGYVFRRPGRKHDIYEGPGPVARIPVPRHREIKERLARKILQDARATD